MSRYQRGTMGKLLVQDWDVLTTYTDEPVLRVLTRRQCAALIALSEFLGWETRYLNAPAKDTLDAFEGETRYNLMTDIDLCAVIQACIGEQLTAIQETVNDLAQVAIDNATSMRELEQTTDSEERCGGSTGVVEAMHAENVATYNATEAGVVDNVFELVTRFMAAIPIFGDLPFDELFSLVNWYFENQQVLYQADYDSLKDQMICDLSCFVEANGNEFTWNVWNNWLLYLRDAYPANRAAQLFSRYAPAYQTWLNQIAAFVNKDASLQAYFDKLSVSWDGGLENPIACVDCDCSDIAWCKTWDLTTDAGGWEVYSTPGSYVSGQGFEGVDQTTLWLRRDGFEGRKITSVNVTLTGEDGGLQLMNPGDGTGAFSQTQGLSLNPSNDVSADAGFNSVEDLGARVTIDGLQLWSGFITTIEVCGLGVEPDWGV